MSLLEPFPRRCSRIKYQSPVYLLLIFPLPPAHSWCKTLVGLQLSPTTIVITCSERAFPLHTSHSWMQPTGTPVFCSIHLLELLRHPPSHSMEVTEESEYLAYQIMLLLYQYLHSFVRACMQSRAHLARYRMAVEDQIPDVCKGWVDALANPVRPNHLQQLCYCSTSLMPHQHCLPAQHSIHAPFNPILQYCCPRRPLLELVPQRHIRLFRLTQHHCLAHLDIPPDILCQSCYHQAPLSPCHNRFDADEIPATAVSYSLQLEHISLQNPPKAPPSPCLPSLLPRALHTFLKFVSSTVHSLSHAPSSLLHTVALLSLVNSTAAQYDGTTQTLAGYPPIHTWLRSELFVVTAGGIGCITWSCLGHRIRSNILYQLRAHQHWPIATALGILATELLVLDTLMKQIEGTSFKLAQKM